MAKNKERSPRERVADCIATILDSEDTIQTAAEMIASLPPEKRNREASKMFAVCEANVKLATEERDKQIRAIFARVEEHVLGLASNPETHAVDTEVLRKFADFALKLSAEKPQSQQSKPAK